MNISVSISASVITLAFVFNIYSMALAQSSDFSYEKYVNKKGDTMLYRQVIPEFNLKTKYPLVVFLHGSGERGNDNEAQLKWGIKNFASDNIMTKYQPIIMVPQCPEKDDLGWGNFTENMSLIKSPSRSMILLKELIDKSVKELPVDKDRIYITGLSMGGYGTYDAITRYPDLFAAAVPVCGAGDISKAERIAHIPIWIFHGALDPVVDPILAQKMLEALTKAGGKPGFTQYPDVGHFSWVPAYQDPDLMEWLFSQKKK